VLCFKPFGVPTLKAAAICRFIRASFRHHLLRSKPADARAQVAKPMAQLSEPAPVRWALGWRGLTAGFVAFGVVVLIAIWAPISLYGRHLQHQSAAALAQGTAAQYMPTILTKVPAVREFLAVIVPFFCDAAGHEWVRHPCRDARRTGLNG